MAEPTGVAGSITTQSDIYVANAPLIYVQLRVPDDGGLLHNPDADGYYWGLTGTSTNPVIKLGCYEDVRFGEEVTVNQIRCDATGDQGAIVARDRLTLQFTLKNIFPLSTVRDFLRTGPVTATTGWEKAGIGTIDNQRYFRMYLPRVYDEDAGDLVSITLHKCRVVDAVEIPMAFGQPWAMNITVHAFADTDLPASQRFATIVRYDPSALP